MTDLVKYVQQIENAEDRDTAIRGLMALENAVKQGRQLLSEGKMAFADYMERTGQKRIYIDDTRWYYLSETKRIKCRDLQQTAEAVLASTGGDLGEFCKALSSSAFKQGHVKQVVGEDEHARLFSTEIVKDVKTGESKKQLAVADKRFIS